MKKYLLFICVLFILGSSAKAQESLYASLVEVNARGAFEQDVPEMVYKAKPEYNAIQTHLFIVHQALSKRSIEGLSLKQQANRNNSLNHLKEYAITGTFPKNETHTVRIPVFIDRYGNYCAVGHLIKESGNDDIAQSISHNMNFKYLLDMEDSQLNKWVNESGFTAEELAWIQPGYPPIGEAHAMDDGFNGPVNAILPTANEVLAAGRFDSTAIREMVGISTWISGFAGFDWFEFSKGGLKYDVKDLMEYNGGILAAGNILMADTVGIGSSVAFWDGTKWASLGSFYIGALENIVNSIKVYNGELYAAGQFRSHFTAPTFFSHIAKWNGTEWVGLGGSPQGVVNALEVHDGKLILGGNFSSIDTLVCNHLASYDGTNFAPYGNGVDSYVNALESVGDTLFVGCNVLSPSKQDTIGLGYYYNNQWTTIKGLERTASLVNQKVLTLEQTPYGLFVGGDINYNPLVGIFGKNLMRYHNGALEPFAVLDSTVNVIKYHNDRLYVGGDFITSNLGSTSSDTLNHIAYYNIGQHFDLAELELTNAVIYPNPAGLNFSLNLDHEISISTFKLWDLSGRSIGFEYDKKSSTQYDFEVEKATKGIYILNITTPKGVIEKKIVLGY